MNLDSKFFMALWSVHRVRKLVLEPRHNEVLEALTKAHAGALRAAMNGEAIVTIPPPSGPYAYYRAKWVETGDVRYLNRMVRHVTPDA